MRPAAANCRRDAMYASCTAEFRMTLSAISVVGARATDGRKHSTLYITVQIYFFILSFCRANTFFMGSVRIACQSSSWASHFSESLSFSVGIMQLNFSEKFSNLLYTRCGRGAADEIADRKRIDFLAIRGRGGTGGGNSQRPRSGRQSDDVFAGGTSRLSICTPTGTY